MVGSEKSQLMYLPVRGSCAVRRYSVVLSSALLHCGGSMVKAHGL